MTTCRFTGAAIAVGLFALLVPSFANAQSLADVARWEEARRDRVAKPAKVYSNDDLTPDFTVPLPPEAPAAVEPLPADDATAEESEAAGEAATLSGDAADDGPRDTKGEDWWRARSALHRNRIESQRAQVESLQGRVAQLSRAETAADIRERDLTQGALRKARSDLAYFEEDFANFEATAKQKKILPAWIQ